MWMCACMCVCVRKNAVGEVRGNTHDSGRKSGALVCACNASPFRAIARLMRWITCSGSSALLRGRMRSEHFASAAQASGGGEERGERERRTRRA